MTGRLTDVQFSEHDEIVLARGGSLEPASCQTGAADEFEFAPATSSVRSREMEVPVELLADHMHQDRVFRRGNCSPASPKAERRNAIKRTASMSTTENSRCVEIAFFTPS